MSTPAYGRKPGKNPAFKATPFKKDLLTRFRLSVTNRYTYESGFVPPYDQLQYGTCFKPGTLIRMADGSHCEIERVRNGDVVETAEGRTHRVVGTMLRDYDGDMIEIDARGFANVFSCTSEHPILTRRGYVPAEELTLEDWVCSPKVFHPAEATVHLLDAVGIAGIKRSSFGKRTLNSFKASEQRGATFTVEQVMPKPFFSKNYDLGWIMGLYLAEGSTSQSKVVWTLGAHELETHIATLVRLLASEMGVEARLQVRPNNSINVCIYGAVWVQYFENLFGKYSFGKRLNKLVAGGNRDFLSGIFEGWMAGDGHVRRSKSAVGTTVSRGLALDMFHIASVLGLNPRLSHRDQKGDAVVKSRRSVYRLSVLIGDPNRRGSGLSDNMIGMQDDTHVWKRVGAVRRSHYRGPVFNLHVEGDNSYVADGLAVHNCVGQESASIFEFYMLKRTGNSARVSRTAIYDTGKSWENPPSDRTVDDGMQITDGLLVCERKGWVPESLYPYPTQESGDTAALFPNVPADAWITSFLLKGYTSIPLGDIGAIQMALLKHGPIIAGLDFPMQFENPPPNGVVTATPKTSAGGHCMCIVGFDNSIVCDDGSRGALWVRNSWGTDWGLGGYIWVPYTVVETPFAFDELYTVAA